jgi:hypothetical protein
MRKKIPVCLTKQEMLKTRQDYSLTRFFFSCIRRVPSASWGFRSGSYRAISGSRFSGCRPIGCRSGRGVFAFFQHLNPEFVTQRDELGSLHHFLDHMCGNEDHAFFFS